MPDPQLKLELDSPTGQAIAVAVAVLIVALIIYFTVLRSPSRIVKHGGEATGSDTHTDTPTGSPSGEPGCVAAVRGAAAEGRARLAADRAAPFDAEALFDMSPARANAAHLGALEYNAGDAAAVTGRVYESGARLFGPGGLWNDPANRPRERPLPWALGPLTGPLTASSAGVPAEFAIDATPLPPDFACGYVDLPPATTGGASGIVLLDKTRPNVPRWGSAPNAPPYAESFAAGDPPRARCRDAAGRVALGVSPNELSTPERCSDYWSSEQGGVALGTLAGGGAPVQLAVPDADELSGWSEGGSGTVPMQWQPDSPSI